MKKARAATPEDLKSLVQALGSLVRESVRAEVGAAVLPLRDDIGELTQWIERLSVDIARLGAARPVINSALAEDGRRLLETVVDAELPTLRARGGRLGP